MADKRAYFKLDVGYMSNPKVIAVLDESPTAILLHVASIGYSAQHLTDGEIPVKALLRMTGASQSDADLLVASGLWLGSPDGSKATVHDYLEHQRSAEEVKGLSEAGKRGAKARWNADRNAEANADRNADRMRTAMADASEPSMPREEREERETTHYVGVVADGDHDAPSTSLALAERADVERVCTHLADRIEENGSKRPSVTKAWRDAARLMLDKDDRSEVEVIAAIDWCQTGRTKQARFWRPNVMSMPKLRDKFDQMRLQAIAEREQIGRTDRQQQTNDIFDRAARRMGVTP